MPDAGGIDWRVLTQQKGMSWTREVSLHVALLQLQGLLVGDQAQTDHLNNRPAAPHLALEPQHKVGATGETVRTLTSTPVSVTVELGPSRLQQVKHTFLLTVRVGLQILCVKQCFINPSFFPLILIQKSYSSLIRSQSY